MPVSTDVLGCWHLLELVYVSVEKNNQYCLWSILQSKQDQRCLLTLLMLHSEVGVGTEGDSVSFSYARRQKQQVVGAVPLEVRAKEGKDAVREVGAIYRKLHPTLWWSMFGFYFGVLCWARGSSLWVCTWQWARRYQLSSASVSYLSCSGLPRGVFHLLHMHRCFYAAQQ